MTSHNRRVGAAFLASHAPEAQRPDGESNATLTLDSGALNPNAEPRKTHTANPARGLWLRLLPADAFLDDAILGVN